MTGRSSWSATRSASAWSRSSRSAAHSGTCSGSPISGWWTRSDEAWFMVAGRPLALVAPEAPVTIQAAIEPLDEAAMAAVRGASRPADETARKPGTARTTRRTARGDHRFADAPGRPACGGRLRRRPRGHRAGCLGLPERRDRADGRQLRRGRGGDQRPGRRCRGGARRRGCRRLGRRTAGEPGRARRRASDRCPDCRAGPAT